MSEAAYQFDLDLALELADEADAVTMATFRARDLAHWDKADHTPVTVADRAAEELLRTRLGLARPGDGVLGEEFGESGEARRRWIIDPIDGTKNYLRGVPVWATLIALACADEVVVGVASAPALGQRWWAARGLGAWTVGIGDLAPRRLRVSGISRLSDASFAYASLDGWSQRGSLELLLAVLSQAWRSRAYGDFWGYMLLAEGAVDAVAEPELAVYDMAALVPIVTEAGGVFTSLAGEPGPWGGDALATNGHLHQELRTALSRRDPGRDSDR